MAVDRLKLLLMLMVVVVVEYLLKIKFVVRPKVDFK